MFCPHVLSTCSARQRLLHTGWEHWPRWSSSIFVPTGPVPDPRASGGPILAPCPAPAPVLGSSGFSTKCLPVPPGGSEWPHGWAWAQLRCPFLHQEASLQRACEPGPCGACSPRRTAAVLRGTAQPCVPPRDSTALCAGGRSPPQTEGGRACVHSHSHRKQGSRVLFHNSRCLLGPPCPEGPGQRHAAGSSHCQAGQ